MTVAQLEIVRVSAERQIIELFSSNPYTLYQEYVDKLSWYWKLPAGLKEEWVLDLIRLVSYDTGT